MSKSYKRRGKWFDDELESERNFKSKKNINKKKRSEKHKRDDISFEEYENIRGFNVKDTYSRDKRY